MPRNYAGGKIIVWDSPQTQVFHNSILTMPNQRLKIEMCFNTAVSHVLNNKTDTKVGADEHSPSSEVKFKDGFEL